MSRGEQFQRIRAAVLEATNTCGESQTAVVLFAPPITRADVQAAFDEIDEKLHLVGIHLRFGLEQDTVTAIFEPAGTQSRARPRPVAVSAGERRACSGRERKEPDTDRTSRAGKAAASVRADADAGVALAGEADHEMPPTSRHVDRASLPATAR